MLPTPELTWQHDVSIPVTGGSEITLNTNAVFAIKEAMIGFASNPWTVAGSSDGSSAGMDATDRWIDTGDLIWTGIGNPRSWIALENAAGAQLLIDLEAQFTTGREILIQWFPAGGLTGGTTSTRPSSSNGGVTLVLRENWMFPSITGVGRIHVLHSTDGLHTRVFGTYLNEIKGAWIISEIYDPVTNFTEPRVAYCTANAQSGSTPSGPLFSNLYDSEVARVLSSSGGSILTTSFGAEGAESDAIGQDNPVANEISGLNEFHRMEPISSTLGFRGRLGRIPDIWYTHTGLTTGTTFPLTPSPTREFIQFGDVAVPWNGSLPILT